MKKLMAMIGAVAMSFGLFADATPFSISFEASETAKGVDTTAMTFTNKTDSGWTWAPETAFPLSAYADGEVFAYPTSGTKVRRSDLFEDENNDNYLPLETGTDELIRDVGGNAFLDQLVKFTGFEDPQTNLVTGTKIAIWMSEFENDDESTETNLYVTVGKFDSEGHVEQIALPIAPITGSDGYALNTWYRLSIKSLGNVYADAGTGTCAGFLLYVNGEKVSTTNDAAKSLIANKDEMTPAAYNCMTNKQLFTAIDATDATFTSVGYKGIGAIDDIILDDEGPEFTVETVDVSFTTISGAVIAKVVDGNGTEFTDFTSPISVKPGALTVTLAADTGYKLFGTLTYPASTDDAVEGVINIAAGETTAELVVATLTPFGGTASDLAESELADELAALNVGDKIETILACETDDYSFSADTTITGTATGLSIFVGTEGDSALEVAADIGEDETLTVIFEDEEIGELTISSESVAGTLEANGTTVIDGTIALAEGATFKAAAIDFDTYYGTIALVEGAFVKSLGNTYDDTMITVPEEGDYELKVSDEPDEEDYYTYSAAQSEPPAPTENVAKIGTVEYPTLAAAIEAAAAAGTEVKIELLDNVTENVAISGVTGELDLGGFALTGTVSVAGSTLTITNGTLSWASADFTVAADAEVTIAEDATLTGNGSNEPVIVNGTLNVYGTIDDLRGDGFGVKINPGATVNCYEGCSIASGNSAFKPYPNTTDVDCYLNIYGGTFTSKSPTSGATYGVIYCSKTASKAYIKIAGGTFQALTANGDSIFRNCAAAVFQDANGEAGLDDTCTATFNLDPLAGMNATAAASFCKAGFKPVQSSEDNLWRIAKVYDITFATVENGTLETSVTNDIAAGTPVEVFATPATGYECTQITTNGSAITGTSFDMPADDVEIGATFALQQFTVSAITVENATAVATNTATETGLDLPATVDYNTAIAVTVTPNSGYEYKSAPAGWTKNENGSITTNATVTADLAITVEAPTKAAADPVDPEVPTHYNTTKEAEDAAKAINDNKATMIKTPTGAVAEDYTALFKAVVTANNDVIVELTEDGTNALETAAATIETAVATKLDDIAAAAAGGSVEVLVTDVEPGFWYGVAATAELTAMGATEPATWQQATTEGVTLTVTKPATGNAAFFQTRAKVK